jgi:hypothetical protein
MSFRHQLRKASFFFILLAWSPVMGQSLLQSAARTAPKLPVSPLAVQKIAPSLSPNLAPLVRVPGHGVFVKSASGILLPQFTGRDIQPPAMAAGIELGQALADPETSAEATLQQAFDGALLSRKSEPGLILDPSRVTQESSSQSQTPDPSLSGAALLRRLHEATGRGYKAHEYREASQYMFSTADNIVSHGVRGVVDAYSGIFVPGTSDSGSDYPGKGDQDGDGYPERDGMNVEHTWPQSFFNKSLPMRSDLHHLLPTFQHPNSMRGHYPFGEVTGKPEYSNSAGAKLGGGVFEPPNFSKGKVARAVLYFFTRYYDRNVFQGDRKSVV